MHTTVGALLAPAILALATAASAAPSPAAAAPAALPGTAPSTPPPAASAAAEAAPAAGAAPTSEAPASAQAAASVAGQTPAQPVLPVATLVRAALAVEPAARLPLSPAAEVVVDPAASFEIELSARLVDARLVLVDGDGDLVPATETQEVGGVTRLTLKPAAPLSPGSRYAVRLDGATERELRDATGRRFAPLTLPILAAGTPLPPPAPKRPAKRRRR